MIQPTPAPSKGSQPSPLQGRQASPAAGMTNAGMPSFPGTFIQLNAAEKTLFTDDLMVTIAQLRDIPGTGQDWQDRLDNLLAQLKAREQGDKSATDAILESVSQLWQRQPEDPAVMAQMLTFLSALQKVVATQPNGESLIAELRGIQENRPMLTLQPGSLTVGNLLNEAPYHVNKLANGAPLAPLQAQALLTQQQTDQRLLTLLSNVATLDGEQLSELTTQAQLRQTQPQTPVTAGSLNRVVPGAGGHEFSPLPLDRQSSVWAEQMLSPLAERLRIQSHLGVKQATLRLDPPDLGKLDLQVRTEGDRVFIQISATNPTVRDQLLQLSDRLRHELMFGQSYSQMDVEIAQHSDQHVRQQSHNEDVKTVLASDSHEEQAQRLRKITSDYSLDTYV